MRGPETFLKRNPEPPTTRKRAPTFRKDWTCCTTKPGIEGVFRSHSVSQQVGPPAYSSRQRAHLVFNVRMSVRLSARPSARPPARPSVLSVCLWAYTVRTSPINNMQGSLRSAADRNFSLQSLRTGMLQSWLGNSRPQQLVHATRLQGRVEILQEGFWDEGFLVYV